MLLALGDGVMAPPHCVSACLIPPPPKSQLCKDPGWQGLSSDTSKLLFPGLLEPLLTEAAHQTPSSVGNWRARADLKMFSSSHGLEWFLFEFVHPLGLGAHSLSGAFWNGAGGLARVASALGHARGSFAGEPARLSKELPSTWACSWCSGPSCHVV